MLLREAHIRARNRVQDAYSAMKSEAAERNEVNGREWKGREGNGREGEGTWLEIGSLRRPVMGNRVK